MKLSLTLSIAAAALLMASTPPARADDDPAALSKALSEAPVTLEKALTVSESDGKPISGKFEIEDGSLQLSIYTAKGDGYKEIIVDHNSGAIKKSETITGGDDLKDAKAQNAALAKAASPLSAAVTRAVQANSGYRAVSAVPALEGGHSTANITLMKGDDVKKVTEKLD